MERGKGKGKRKGKGKAWLRNTDAALFWLSVCPVHLSRPRSSYHIESRSRVTSLGTCVAVYLLCRVFDPWLHACHCIGVICVATCKCVAIGNLHRCLYLIPFLPVFLCDIAMLCCLCACKFIKNCCICSLRCIVGDVCLLLQLRYIEYERRKLPPTLLAESTDNTYQVRQTDKYEIKINPRHVLLLLFCLCFSSHGHFFSYYVAFFALDECYYVGWSVFHLTCLVDWLGQRPEPCVQTPTPTPAPRSTFNMNIHALSSVSLSL